MRILWHQARHSLSVDATARAFVVSVQSLFNWRREVASGTTHRVHGPKPVNRLPDLVTDLVQRLKREWPPWGTRRIAGVLARLGVEASRSTVQRVLRRPHRPAKASTKRTTTRGPLVAKRPGHLWFIDFTRVGGLLRSVVVGAVIDGFSRKVLSIAVAPKEPNATFAVRLIREAVDAHGAPTWVVSDHGRQLRSKAFARALRSRGIGHRFGAIGRSGSIAVIERIWRSMKSDYARGLVLFRPLRSIEVKLRGYADWFGAHRPHQGLAGRTPDEVHERVSTRATVVPLRAVVEVGHIDRDHRLPVLRLRRARVAAFSSSSERRKLLAASEQPGRDPLPAPGRSVVTISTNAVPEARPDHSNGAGPLQPVAVTPFRHETYDVVAGASTGGSDWGDRAVPSDRAVEWLPDVGFEPTDLQINSLPLYQLSYRGALVETGT